MINDLILAEDKARKLFDEIEKRNLIVDGILESQLNKSVYDLAHELFGIDKYWHKRIVRSGANTLLAYKHNPPDLIIQKDDILFFDFGPVFDEWEADFGRTYVIGNDQRKVKLKNDVEEAWYIGQKYFLENYFSLTGQQFYHFTSQLAIKMGWTFANEHCGHLIGSFPHERILGDEVNNYFHQMNQLKISDKDIYGNERFWIYEVHFVDEKFKIGSFFEQLVSKVD